MNQGPNVFILGAARSGTSATADLLARHDEVFVSEPKEPHFLAFCESEQTFTGPGDDIMMNNEIVRDLEPYLRLFQSGSGHAKRVDGSASSLYYPERSIRTLKKHFRDAKLIVILRDPVERAYSSYQYLRYLEFEMLSDFSVALEHETQRIAAGWHHMWHYTRVGRYGEQIPYFVDAFPPAQLLVTFHDELRTNQPSFVARLCSFLDLEVPTGLALREVNASGQPRSKILNNLIRRASRNPVSRTIIQKTIPTRVRHKIRKATLQQTSIPRSVESALRESFAADLRKLQETLSQNPSVVADHDTLPRWLSHP